MAEHKKARAEEEPLSFARFIHKTVEPLSRVFAESPLMQLRVKTPHGSVTLAKPSAAGRPGPVAPADVGEAVKPGHARSAPQARIYNGEVGRAYNTINAEVVGLFRDIAEPPATGDRLEAGRVLGHIEALRLRNIVRCPVDCTLIAQVVVDGQPVDFGEPLFVVDSGGVEIPQSIAAPEVEIAEPPRI